MATRDPPFLLCLQPAATQHRYIRGPNASHIYERPERVRAVMLGAARAVAGMEEAREEAEERARREARAQANGGMGQGGSEPPGPDTPAPTDASIDALLSGLSLQNPNGPDSITKDHRDLLNPSPFVRLPPVPPPPANPGEILLKHPAVRVTHATEDVVMPLVGYGTRWRARRDRRSSLVAKDAVSSGAPPGAEGFRPGAQQPLQVTTSSLAPAPALPDSAYLPALLGWARDAPTRIKETGCEFPPDSGLHAGDLYLGPGSVLAIEGCIQTVCQAVDAVCEGQVSAGPRQAGSPGLEDTTAVPSPNKAFCVIRPPGHHCGEDTPSGFCYVNNVVVAAMHAYIEHDYDRAVILDFDLHHGNGTQSIVMSLNEASRRDALLVEGGKPLHALSEEERECQRRKRAWTGFYGSLHDIYSYPCEDGDVDLIKDASVSLASHGQYIENVHLQPYASEEDFHTRLYPRYLQVLRSAERYLEETQADSERTVVLISAGFDACEYEHQAMQRHHRRVPPSFFSRFTADVRHFADRHAHGKIVSMLEGGYSDRALATGTMSHLHGLCKDVSAWQGIDWWQEQNVAQLERATRKKRNGRLAPFPSDSPREPALLRMHALLDVFETHGTGDRLDTPARSIAAVPEQPRRTLRERKKPAAFGEAATPPPARGAGSRPKAKSAANTPVHHVVPKVPATEERPSRATPATPTPDHLADALEISMQRMTLQKQAISQRQPSTPLRVVHHAVDNDSPSLHIISAMKRESAGAPSPTPLGHPIAAPAAPFPHIEDAALPKKESSPPLAPATLPVAVTEPPVPIQQRPSLPTEFPTSDILSAEERKIYLKFARPKLDSEAPRDEA